MTRMKELSSVDGLLSVMDFLSDKECTELSTMGGPRPSHWTALFDALRSLNEIDIAFDYFSQMLIDRAPPTTRIVNCLIALCHENAQFARGLQLFSAIETLKLAPDAFTFAEMIRLHIANDQIDDAHKFIDAARDAHCLSAMHFNALLSALAAQQRHNARDEASFG